MSLADRQSNIPAERCRNDAMRLQFVAMRLPVCDAHPGRPAGVAAPNAEHL
jgi:hypothetical protein